MFQTLINAWKIADLRRKVLYTLLILLIFRIGSAISVPFVDVAALTKAVGDSRELGFLTLLSGGGFSSASIFALSITPYINASIIIQLLTVALPPLERLAKEGEAGRKKLSAITRYVTVALGLMLGIAYYFMVRNKYGALVSRARIGGFDEWFAAIVIILCFTAGSALMMWLGEQINKKGIGNGISMLLFAGILSRAPVAAKQLLLWFYEGGIKMLDQGGIKNVILIPLVLILFLAIIAFIVFMTNAERRIPVQYAKRVVGHGKMMQGGTQYLPLKLNYSGVMPVIFATAIMALPQMLAQMMFDHDSWVIGVVNTCLSPNDVWYYIISAVMIYFFSYFWVATMFQPPQIAEDLKRSGGYIPGVRPGPPTAAFLDQTMSRLTFSGSLFLTLIYFLPSLLTVFGKLPPLVTQFFGGTSLLILVGVLLDMMRQVEATLLQRNYDGFMKKGKIRGKYSHLQGTGQAAEGKGLVIIWIIIALFVLAGAVVMAG